MELNKMIRPFCCFLLYAFSFQLTQAQTFAEWFSQKKTQIKYLTQQIAALERYGSYVKQGYTISQHGLGNIGEFISGEYGLHSGYYGSLKTVNPEIKSNGKADSIVRYTEQIPGQFDHLNNLNGLDNDNRRYIAQVKTKVLDECNKDLAELQLVIADRQAQMTDNERIKRLDEIYGRMKDKYAFTQSFCNQVRMLLIQRSRELDDVQSLGRYYGIN
jgi:uncharacterized coiled-coil protein SlyX